MSCSYHPQTLNCVDDNLTGVTMISESSRPPLGSLTNRGTPNVGRTRLDGSVDYEGFHPPVLNKSVNLYSHFHSTPESAQYADDEFSEHDDIDWATLDRPGSSITDLQSIDSEVYEQAPPMSYLPYGWTASGLVPTPLPLDDAWSNALAYSLWNGYRRGTLPEQPPELLVVKIRNIVTWFPSRALLCIAMFYIFVRFKKEDHVPQIHFALPEDLAALDHFLHKPSEGAVVYLYRLFCLAIMLSHKWHEEEDRIVSRATWGKQEFFGLSTSLVSCMEIVALQLLDYKLHIDAGVYQQWLAELRLHYTFSHLSPSIIAPILESLDGIATSGLAAIDKRFEHHHDHDPAALAMPTLFNPADDVEEALVIEIKKREEYAIGVDAYLARRRLEAEVQQPSWLSLHEVRLQVEMVIMKIAQRQRRQKNSIDRSSATQNIQKKPLSFAIDTGRTIYNQSSELAHSRSPIGPIPSDFGDVQQSLLRLRELTAVPLPDSPATPQGVSWLDVWAYGQRHKFPRGLRGILFFQQSVFSSEDIRAV